MCENKRYKAISLCNIAIIEADKYIYDSLVSLGDPELEKKNWIIKWKSSSWWRENKAITKYGTRRNR